MHQYLVWTITSMQSQDQLDGYPHSYFYQFPRRNYLETASVCDAPHCLTFLPGPVTIRRCSSPVLILTIWQTIIIIYTGTWITLRRAQSVLDIGPTFTQTRGELTLRFQALLPSSLWACTDLKKNYETISWPSLFLLVSTFAAPEIKINTYFTLEIFFSWPADWGGHTKHLQSM